MNRVPKRLRFAQKCSFIPQGSWVDIGAGKGAYIPFMPKGSRGLDIAENKKLGIAKWNFLDSFPDDLLGVFNVAWCSNLIEHVLDPHKFLINVRKLLKADGNSVLIIACPNTIFINKGPWKGTLAEDHVNFFNLRTLKLTLQYSGYEIVYSGSPSFPKMPLFIARMLGAFGPTLFVVARPILEFQYHDLACKVLDNQGNIQFKEGITPRL
jgi:hypothetical protein